MTDAEREVLVERMAVAFVGLRWIGAPEALRAAWRQDMHAALIVAERVVREDCIAVTREALNRYGRWDAAITPDTLMAKIEPAIRARGAA